VLVGLWCFWWWVYFLPLGIAAGEIL